jgi:hypothetical protein
MKSLLNCTVSGVLKDILWGFSNVFESSDIAT